MPNRLFLQTLLPILLLGVSLADVWNVPGAAPRAITAIDRDTLRTGDRLIYRVRMEGVQRFNEALYPDSADLAPDFLIRSLRRERDRLGDTLTYELTYFGVDGERVPELRAGLVRGNDTVYVIIPGVSFVYQGRVEDPEAALRPLKPLFPFPRSGWPYILTGMAAAGIAAWLIKRYRRYLIPEARPAPPAVVPPEPFRNPLDDLQYELDRVRKEYDPPHRHSKRFYTGLGDAFRCYFERVCHFPAMESTTGELIRDLGLYGADGDIVERVTALLQEADLVKFAKYEASEADCKNVMRAAQTLFMCLSESDRERIALLRRKHEEKQNANALNENDHDLG